MIAATVVVSLLLGCGPKKAPQAAGSTVSLAAPAPAPAAGAPFAPPVPTSLDLGNGASAWLVPQPGLPLVSLRLLVPGGRAADPADQPGLSAFADSMLTHGAGDRDAQAFAAATDQLAIDLGAVTTDTWTVLHLDVHADRLEPALDLLVDAALRPRFDADEVDRVRELRVGELTYAMDDPRTVAAWVSDRAWYGAGHPLSRPVDGTLASTQAFQPAELKASWERRREQAAPRLVVVGDVSAERLQALLTPRLAAWKVTGSPPAPPPPPPAITQGPALYLVDNPGSSQTMLMLTMPGPAAGDADLDAARMGTIVLGGTFTSRLNRLLREEKGYTYGARASLRAAPGAGAVVVGTAVQREVTAPALVDLLAEVQRLQGGLSPDELTKARGAWQTDLVEAAATRASLADFYEGLARLGQDPAALGARLQAVSALEPGAALAALAESQPTSGAVVVVGDLAEIQAAVQAAVPGRWQVVDKLGEEVD